MRLILGVLFALLTVSGHAGSTDWHVLVRNFAKQTFKHPAWGYSHNERDYQLARALAADDHVTLDDDVLFAAAYLHDVAAFEPWSKNPGDHSDVGAEAVGKILGGMDFPGTKLGAVQEAIRTHMYYRDPKTPEAVYLHDADALDWLGAIGVARIFGLVDPNGGTPDGPKALERLLKNAKEVPPRVFSPAGRARAPALSAELDGFLENLKRETDDYKTL